MSRQDVDGSAAEACDVVDRSLDSLLIRATMSAFCGPTVTVRVDSHFGSIGSPDVAED